MKFSYEFIKENIRIYEEAKEILPIISEFEKSQVSYNVMRNIGLEKFALFYQFLSELELNGFSPIQAISYKELKSILIDKTTNQRFKTYLKNKTLSSFKKLIEDDSQTFDRLLNGRWLSKPGYYGRNGRKRWGRRSNEFVEGFNIAFVPLLNWIICNDIDTCDLYDGEIYKKFSQQDKLYQKMRWYLSVELTLDSVPKNEIEVTHNLLVSLVDFIQNSSIDFRKLNSDFIIDTLQNKIRCLMNIEKGTSIVSVSDFKSTYNSVRLTAGKSYIVENSNVSNGFLRVMVIDDSGIRNWYDYSQFEDKSLQRDLLLAQLGI